MELKDRLKEIRRERSVAAGKLADLTGKAESTVRTWETGKSFPDADTLSKIADFFDVSVDWLLGRSVYQNAKQGSDYEWRFINSTYRDSIEQIRKRLIDICGNHRGDVNKSPLYKKWFMDTIEECADSFDSLLSEVENGSNDGTIKGICREIMGAVDDLALDILNSYAKIGKGEDDDHATEN